jgi:hypothetical protein
VVLKSYYDTDLFIRLEKFAAEQKNNLIFDFPIIRIQLAFFLGKFNGNKYDVSKISKDISYKKLPFNLGSFGELFKLRVQLIFLCLYNRNLLKNKVLLFGFSEHYYKQEGGIEFNLYLSPFKSELEKMGIEFEELLLSQSNFDGKLTRLKVFYDILYQYNTLSFSLKAKLYNKYRTYIENADLLKGFLVKNNIPEVAHCITTYYNAKLLHEIAYGTFKDLLRITQPKLIWVYAYNNNNVLALCRAANSRQIPIVEYQHSQQSDFHFAYSKWNLMDKYSQYFPSVFWAWSSEDANRISKNFSTQKYRPLVISGGNMAIIQKKRLYNYKEPSASNGVLVSLAGEWIPEFVEKFISEDTKHTWYFRLHPRYPQDKVRLMEFQKRFPGKIETNIANTLSIYQLFTFVIWNITNSSGTALEAEHFGIRNVIIGERGKEVYKEKIESGEFLAALNSNELSFIMDGSGVEKAKKIEPIKNENEGMKKLILAFDLRSTKIIAN